MRTIVSSHGPDPHSSLQMGGGRVCWPLIATMVENTYSLSRMLGFFLFEKLI